ncbi:RraA family protein [Phytohabitans kaempferiae]|uniref:Putative 4-hydroxy-4-methyl-2-oxoglutarate aldolase n=1 Tax=Phytohabitans kaempferiae TaxID=1620943 RepID=A0ABV6MHU3_9ACTN
MAEVTELLGRVATATLSAQLHRRGYRDTSIEGVTTNVPGARLVGVARTLRLVPYRPDLFERHGGGYNAQKRAFDSLRPGDVLVIDARGERRAGTLGDVLAARAAYLGAAGIVTDGCVRDATAVAAVGIPTFSAAPHPALIGRRHVPWAVDETIACGGAAVQPGDLIVGDDDGVLVIPPHLAEEVARAALAQELEERFISEMVTRGEQIDGLYPMNPAWRERYDAWRRELSDLEEL